MQEYLYAEVFITFLPTAAGGRSHPVNLDDHGYQPHVRVPPDGEYLGVEFVDGPEEVYPGDQTYATVRFLYTSKLSYDTLTVGTAFEICEGPHTIGRGTITRR
jgi:hypothetical protein